MYNINLNFTECLFQTAVLLTGWNEIIHQWFVDGYDVLGETGALDEEEFNFYKEYLYIVKCKCKDLINFSPWGQFL